MNSRDFVLGIREEVLNANLNIYKQMFAKSNVKKATDPYGKQALQLYSNLDDADREILFKIMRQVMVDTISNVFAVLDGVTRLPQQDGTLTVQLSGQRLEGALQDQFLEMEEEQAS